MSIFNHFQHLALTSDQEEALNKLESFLNNSTKVFMLKGYAGSGKTTILKGLLEYLNSLEKDFASLAPTGRAAKVLREKTGQLASTIHKGIYSYEEMQEVENADIEGGKSFFYFYKIRNNSDVSNKIFIVDEASMLSDAKNENEFFRFGTGHLLSDLIYYTRVEIEAVNSKIIFVGDPCQLPPIGDNNSKAFDSEYLSEKFHLTSDEVEMLEVKRQGQKSGLLASASRIRRSISSSFFNDFNLKDNSEDIFNLPYHLFLESWENTSGSKIIIASKNKTCLDINLQIRELRFGKADLPVQKSDIIILGGNNYRKGVFNGEFAVVNEVAQVAKIESVKFYRKGSSGQIKDKAVTQEVVLRWRAIELIFPDAESSNKVVKGQILENFLYGDNYLKSEEMQALYVDFKNRHQNLKPKSQEFKEAIINDEYFNCLLIKYGYAVTCHKAQGGEWDNVFIVWDHDNKENFDCFVDLQLKAGKSNQGFYRWAYTAVTRASKKLFAINPPYFNSYSSMAIMDLSVINSVNELNGGQLQTDIIPLEKDLLNQLRQYNLLDEAIQLQDHFIKIRHAGRKQFIEVTGWERNGYEIRYKFQRENSFVTGKTSINGKNEFKNSLLFIPALSNDESLFRDIVQYWNNLPNVTIKRNTAETILSKIQFDFEFEEQFPFTRNLFDDLVIIFSKINVAIDNVEHLQYKERYTFKRNQELATVDFEYKMNGFFGRVLPIQKMCPDITLLNEILITLVNLKIQENVI
jgi:hypothetical protein